jgi:DoxX-like family
MHTQATQTFVADEKLAILLRSRWNWRTIAFWATTFVVVFELAAGSVWNLMRIEWIRVQLDHLGYPLYFAYILGVWHVAGAAAIVAPGFPRLKEWAYAGALFNWSGAVASHLLAGDGVEAWLTPLVFLMFGIASWALRSADRRLPDAGLAPEPTIRAWAVPIGLLILLYALSFLTLPWVNVTFHQRAVDLGWIPR